MCGCRRSGVSLAPNVSLSRKPFIKLQQQLKLKQRDAVSATINEIHHKAVTTNDDVAESISDTESTSSDRCKSNWISCNILTEHSLLTFGNYAWFGV